MTNEAPESSSGSNNNQALKWLGGVAAFVIIVAGMRAASSLMVPFLLAAFLAVISAPPLHFLQRKGFPKILALLTVMSLATVIFLFGVIVVTTSMQEVVGKSDVYIGRLKGMTDNVVRQIADIRLKLEEKLDRNKDNAKDDSEASSQPVPPVTAETSSGQNFNSVGNQGTQDLENLFDASQVFTLFRRLLSSLSEVFGNAFMVILTLVFILLEGSGFSQKVLALSDRGEERLANLDGITLSIRQYVSIKTWLSLMTGGLITIWLYLIGMPYALMWGMLAFFFNFIPNIGSILAAIPAVLIALLEGEPGSFYLVINTTICFLVVNIVIGNVIEPRVMGQGLGLSTLIVFVSLVFWGWVFGPLGMLLSVPLTMIFKIILAGNQETRWLAILLSDNPETLPPLNSQAS